MLNEVLICINDNVASLSQSVLVRLHTCQHFQLPLSQPKIAFSKQKSKKTFLIRHLFEYAQKRRIFHYTRFLLFLVHSKLIIEQPRLVNGP